MTKLLLAILALFALPSVAVPAPDAVAQKVTVAQLEQALATANSKPEAEAAQQLSRLELTERLNATRLAHWQAVLSGEKARRAVADSGGPVGVPGSP